MAPEPQTLQEAVIYFADTQNCYDYMVPRRWANGEVTCPTCGSKKVSFLKNQMRWQCSSAHPKRQFSLKTGTVMEDSALGLDKWMVAMWLIVGCKNGISSYEVSRALGIAQKNAWHMMHRLRLAMQGADAEKFTGEVEADETFVGGKVQNMHLDKKTRLRMGKKRTGGFEGKAVVMGLLERHSKKVRIKMLPNTRTQHIHGHIKENVEVGSTIYSDSLASYRKITNEGFAHDFIDHAEKYVEGVVHTNGLENFWSCFKRSLKGTYVSVEPFHLQAYADEQAFRFNYRKDMNDADRFDIAVRQVVGKRLTWDELTGKDSVQSETRPV
ncbi:MAG: IS1595 family transposase [Bryobacteraceae bacterium]